MNRRTLIGRSFRWGTVLPIVICAGTFLLTSTASSQLRLATYNITNYAGGRVSDLQTIIYGDFQGRSLSPDALICVEFLGQTAADSFLQILNSAPGTPGDWAIAPFIDGADSESVFCYRTSKVEYLGTTIVAVGSASPSNQPRNTYRYDIRPIGYASEASVIACYATHMKSGGTTTDQLRRLVEAQRIRDDAAQLPADWQYLVAGDFNIPDAAQSAYQALIGNGKGEAGRFFDPIGTTANWRSAAFRFVHTQDPAGSGGMDDRFDQILLCSRLVDADGFDYIGNPQVPYSTSTWNDANHSYRAWGNDGTSFDQPLAVAGNAMVGATIAQALVDVAQGNGHIPVYLDLRVPPEIAATTFVNFGIVGLGSDAGATFHVANDGDAALWGLGGVAALRYTMTVSPGFQVAAGPFEEAAGGGSNAHVVTLDATSSGYRRGWITIRSNAPDEPVRTVEVFARVIAPGGVPWNLPPR